MKPGRLILSAAVGTILALDAMTSFWVYQVYKGNFEEQQKAYQVNLDRQSKEELQRRQQAQEQEQARRAAEQQWLNDNRAAQQEQNRILAEQSAAEQRRWEHSVQNGPRRIEAGPSQPSQGLAGRAAVTQQQYNETRSLHKLTPREEWYMACKALNPNDPCE